MTEVDRVRRLIDSQEQRIATEGGSFGKNREKLTRRQTELRTLIDRDESVIRGFSAGVLPFALVPRLCADLKEQLRREDDAIRRRTGREALSRTRRFFQEQIQSERIFKGLALSTNIRTTLESRLLKLTDEAIDLETSSPETATVHDLSSADRDKLLEWMQAADGSVAPESRRIADDLERHYRELHKVEKTLGQVPAEEALKPLVEELSTYHRELRKGSQKVTALEADLTSLREEKRKLEREHSRELDRLATAATQISRIQMVPRVKSVLDQYRRMLVEKKVSDLQEEATECFNRLSRKKDALRTIRISPDDYSIVLLDGRGHPLAKNLLSAGEKQIYAVSMLWALARTSGRPLPMIVDTPLGRLDSDHRNLLVKEYFPMASHQVIVLSTDTEVDEQYFNQLLPYVSHAYHLEFDPDDGSSRGTAGYFWKRRNEAH